MKISSCSSPFGWSMYSLVMLRKKLLFSMSPGWAWQAATISLGESSRLTNPPGHWGRGMPAKGMPLTMEFANARAIVVFPILGAPARRTSELGWKRVVVVGRWRNLKGRSVRLKKGLSIVRDGSN